MATRRRFVQVAAGAGIVSAAGAPPLDAAERSSTATALKTDVLVCGGGCAGEPLTLHFRIGRVKRNAELTKNCREALKKSQESGDLPHYYGPGVMFLFADDEVYVHGVRVPANPTGAAHLSRAEMQGRRDAHAMFTAWKKGCLGSSSRISSRRTLGSASVSHGVWSANMC